MLELARGLADCDESFFGGWIIAGMEVHLHGASQRLENRTLLAKKRKCIMQVVGTDAAGRQVKELCTFLVLPASVGSAAKREPVEPTGELLAEHCFSVQEVRDYVAFTGDRNIIHEGEHPIVPGLCMASWLQGELGLTELDWRISFLAPVYTDEELRVFREEKQLVAYVGGARVFSIKY